MNYSEYGKVIRYEDAKIYCEGNPKLLKVLLFCIDNKKTTYSCCSGHFFDSYEEYFTHFLKNSTVNYSFEEFKEKFPTIKRYNPYIAFNYSNSPNFLKYLLNSEIANDKHVQIRINCVKSDHIHNIMLTCKIPKDVDKAQFLQMQNNFFENMLNTLTNYSEQKSYNSVSYELSQLLNEHTNRYEIRLKDSIVKEIWSITDKNLVIPNFEFERRGVFSVNRNVNSISTNDVITYLQNIWKIDKN